MAFILNEARLIDGQKTQANLNLHQKTFIQTVLEKISFLLKQFNQGAIEGEKFRQELAEINIKHQLPEELELFLWAMIPEFIEDISPHVRKPPPIEVVSSTKRFIDAVYIKQGLKAGIAVLSIPIIWMIFDFSGFDQIAMAALILLNMNQATANHQAFNRVLGCSLGVLGGLIILGMDITSFPYYMFMVFLSCFIFSFLFYLLGPLGYIGSQGAIGFFITAVTGYSYQTDLVVLQGVWGLILCIIAVKIINENIWPVSKVDLLRFEVAKLHQKLLNIMSNYDLEHYVYIKTELAQSIIENNKIKLSELDSDSKESIFLYSSIVCSYLYKILGTTVSKDGALDLEANLKIIRYFINHKDLGSEVFESFIPSEIGAQRNKSFEKSIRKLLLLFAELKSGKIILDCDNQAARPKTPMGGFHSLGTKRA